MNRLTSNKKVSEMDMYELAYNSCYTKDGKARIRDFENDFDARELTRNILEELADDAFIDNTDETFDETITDYLQYGTSELVGLIAVFYRNLWAMADLRERLKDYEDAGLTPEQLKAVNEEYKELSKEATKYRWIPVTERLPDDDEYILVSFSNYPNHDIGRYEWGEEGGAFYPGDDETSYVKYGIFVNAWMPLPRYKTTNEG